MPLPRRWMLPCILLATLTILGCGFYPWLGPRAWPTHAASTPVSVAVATAAPAPLAVGATPVAGSTSAPAPGVDAATRAQADAFEQVLVDIYARVSPSVVYVEVTSQSDLPAGSGNGEDASPAEPFLEDSEGSGFVFDTQGHIVTNHHVVADALQVDVVLADGESYPARVVGSDEDSDLAVLQIEAPGEQLTPVELGDSASLRVGQRAVAIGNPFGFEHTLTSGIISSIGRVIDQMDDFAMADMIQTDAAINPGNSGGPLLDSYGRLIGVNVLLYSYSGTSSGVGFAIPVNTVKRVVPELIATGAYQHPWLGVRGVSLDRRLAEALGLPVHRGALLQEIIDGGPAQAAGLRGATSQVQVSNYGSVPAGGDIVTAVDACRVASFDDLVGCVNAGAVGQLIQLTLVRDGAETTVSVRLEARPEDPVP
jgi:S1-C subfamily serine protease